MRKLLLLAVLLTGCAAKQTKVLVSPPHVPRKAFEFRRFYLPIGCENKGQLWRAIRKIEGVVLVIDGRYNISVKIGERYSWLKVQPKVVQVIKCFCEKRKGGA